MKVQALVTELKEFDVARVVIIVPADEVESDNHDDAFPLLYKRGAVYEIPISDEGFVLRWPGGSYSGYWKVCDEGTYRMESEDGTAVFVFGDCYVPPFIPGEYGDFIDLKIGSDGKVAGWDDAFQSAIVVKAIEGRSIA